MLYILPMTTYPHVDRYHEELRQLIEFGGSDNEQSIRRAFESCLTAYCREHREKMELVAHRRHGNCPVGSPGCAQRGIGTNDRHDELQRGPKIHLFAYTL